MRSKRDGGRGGGTSVKGRRSRREDVDVGRTRGTGGAGGGARGGRGRRRGKERMIAR